MHVLCIHVPTTRVLVEVHNMCMYVMHRYVVVEYVYVCLQTSPPLTLYSSLHVSKSSTVFIYIYR